MKDSGRRARISSFLRAFLIQGSWNNRSMIGGGFAFAMLPVLRKLYPDDREGFGQALNRHSEHFNAHPYLANLALGATIRMEEEERAPEEIRRFKLAVRGPLGSLGDALVWAGWRPATVLGALVLALAGAPPWAPVSFFLLAYNLGHVLLRAWGHRIGLDQGSQVGNALRGVGFSRQARRLSGLAIFLLGGLAGLAMVWGWRQARAPLFVLVMTAGVWGLWLGSLVGQRGWRWTYWAVSASIGLILLVGWIG